MTDQQRHILIPLSLLGIVGCVKPTEVPRRTMIVPGDQPLEVSVGPVPLKRPVCGFAGQPTGSNDNPSTEVTGHLVYDERGRLSSADTQFVVDAGAYCWTETWTYDDSDRLVRHELLQHKCGMGTWPRLDEYIGPYDSWSCYLPLGEVMPKIETWEYHDSGDLRRWTLTGWDYQESAAECVPSQAEDIVWEAVGRVNVQAQSWEFGDFLASLPAYDPDTASEAQTLDWYTAGRYFVMAGQLPAGLPGQDQALQVDADGRLLHWQNGEADLTLGWERGALASLESSTDNCSAKRQFEVADGYPSVEHLDGQRSWRYGWTKDHAELSSLELVGGDQPLRLEFVDGELRRMSGWGWDFTVYYCTEGGGDPMPSYLVPFTLLADPRTTVDRRRDVGGLPSVLFAGLGGEPVAAPGVWGSGRAWNVLEPGGAAFGMCPERP